MADELFDGEDVTRILRRAHELEHRDPDATPAVGVSGDALIEAAAEIGIDRDAVRDSLAIERLDACAPAPRRLDGLAGPAIVTVERELPLTVSDALEAIETWLTSRHRMRCIPQHDGSLRFHRRTDTAASIGRRVAGLRGEGRLGQLRVITVRAAPQIVGTAPDAPRTIVQVEADRDSVRRTRLSGGAAVGAVGIGGAVIAVEAGLVLGPAVAIPVLAAGFVAARSGRTQAEQVELEVERLLTSVEREESPSRRGRRALHSQMTRHWAGMRRHA